MPRGYPALSREQRDEILGRIKEKGERVPDLAREYGVSPKTIYNTLRNSLGGGGDTLEIAKLKREKEALAKIIIDMMLDDESKRKKKRSSHGN